MPIRPVLAEDSYLVRDGLARLLQTRPEVRLRSADPLSYLPIFGGAMVPCLTVGATSVAARRSGAFQGWLALPGYALAPALLLSVPLWGIPLALFGIWVVATSVVMLRGDARERSQRAIPSPA